MLIRPYVRNDAAAIVGLFHDTVHRANAADYRPAQLAAWAPRVPDPALWHARMAKRHTLVAEDKGEILAFAELDESGILDMFYCRHDARRQGIGSRLFVEIQKTARGQGMTRIVTEASITARPFFERQGFLLTKRNSVVRNGIELTNFSMEKKLD